MKHRLPQVPFNYLVLEGGRNEPVSFLGFPLNVLNVAFFSEQVPSCPFSSIIFLYGYSAS